MNVSVVVARVVAQTVVRGTSVLQRIKDGRGEIAFANYNNVLHIRRHCPHV